MQTRGVFLKASNHGIPCREMLVPSSQGCALLISKLLQSKVQSVGLRQPSLSFSVSGPHLRASATARPAHRWHLCQPKASHSLLQPAERLTENFLLPALMFSLEETLTFRKAHEKLLKHLATCNLYCTEGLGIHREQIKASRNQVATFPQTAIKMGPVLPSNSPRLSKLKTPSFAKS